MKVKRTELHRINTVNHKASIYVTFEDQNQVELQKEILVIDGTGFVYPRKYQEFYHDIYTSQRLKLKKGGFRAVE